MKYDLFVADFDGTLGSAPDIVNPETVDAIKRYVNKGGIFAICTGRIFSSIKKICNKYGINGYAIACQGNVIKDVETDDEVFVGGMDKSLALEITKKLLTENEQVLVYIGFDFVYEKESVYTNHYETNLKIKGVKVDSLIKAIEETDKKILKIVVVSEPDRISNLLKKYKNQYANKLVINSGSPRLVEIIDPSCTKGEAIKKLARHYNIGFDKIITVGDSTNDMELVDGPWHGVAVGDAKEELKKVAKEITVDFDEQPVKVLLEKYCL